MIRILGYQILTVKEGPTVLDKILIFSYDLLSL